MLLPGCAVSMSRVRVTGNSQVSRVRVDNKRYLATSRAAERLTAALVRRDCAVAVRSLAEPLGVSVGTAPKLRTATLECMVQERRWSPFAAETLCALGTVARLFAGVTLGSCEAK